MAKLPLIEIRPNNASIPDLYDRQFVDSGTASDFMLGRDWNDWKLYIHGRLYNWPKQPNILPSVFLADHIMHCIDTDIAFYGYD